MGTEQDQTVFRLARGKPDFIELRKRISDVVGKQVALAQHPVAFTGRTGKGVHHLEIRGKQTTVLHHLLGIGPANPGQRSAQAVRRDRPFIYQQGVERQSITLTENQQFIFEGLRDNERCLVRGGAGTGKTLLAINLARDLANENNNTAFFCYNTKLADYLKDNTAGDDLGYCGSMTEYMIEVLQIYTSGGSFSLDEFPDKDKFYRETLPELFSECFIENELPQFDYLIIDEAQDLMTENYLEVLDIILAGGLAGGNWCLFMDAGRQNIFHAGMTYEDIKKLLKDRRVFFARFELKDNCRNSISIIKEIDNIFGTTTRYPAVDEKGAPVVKKIYKKDKDQAKLITETLNSLIADGVRPELITVLSPYRYKNSVISSVSADISVSEVRETGSVFFSTIDSFKGLENSVIIITDIDTFFNDKNLSRLYIGMTRARSALYLLVSETANKNLSKIRKMTKK